MESQLPHKGHQVSRDVHRRMSCVHPTGSATDSSNYNRTATSSVNSATSTLNLNGTATWYRNSDRTATSHLNSDRIRNFNPTWTKVQWAIQPILWAIRLTPIGNLIEPTGNPSDRTDPIQPIQLIQMTIQPIQVVPLAIQCDPNCDPSANPMANAIAISFRVVDQITVWILRSST